MAKVLLAEDDQTMVSLLKTLLGMEGYEVVALDVSSDVPARRVQQESLICFSWMSTWVNKVAWRSSKRFERIQN